MSKTGTITIHPETGDIIEIDDQPIQRCRCGELPLLEMILSFDYPMRTAREVVRCAHIPSKYNYHVVCDRCQRRVVGDNVYQAYRQWQAVANSADIDHLI